jgi:hypothetical protein
LTVKGTVSTARAVHGTAVAVAHAKSAVSRKSTHRICASFAQSSNPSAREGAQKRDHRRSGDLSTHPKVQKSSGGIANVALSPIVFRLHGLFRLIQRRSNLLAGSHLVAGNVALRLFRVCIRPVSQFRNGVLDIFDSLNDVIFQSHLRIVPDIGRLNPAYYRCGCRPRSTDNRWAAFFNSPCIFGRKFFAYERKATFEPFCNSDLYNATAAVLAATSFSKYATAL